jgi:hypothetical protein
MTVTGLAARLTRPRVLIALGVVLLLSPVAVMGADLGAPTNDYYVGYLELDDGEYTVTNEFTGEYDRDVLCWGSDYRSCALERSLLERRVNVSFSPGAQREYALPDEYRFVAHDGEFYDPTASDGQLRLAPVDAREVFGTTALDASGLPESVAQQLTAGTQRIETHADLPDAQLIALGNGRYATLEHGATSRTTVNAVLDAVEVPLAVSGFAAGVWLVLRGQRRRVRETR